MNRLFAAIKKLNESLTPPPDLLISEWADEYRILSREASAESGKWRTSRAPYFREPMDACKDPLVQDIVAKSASQMGKSELLLNIIGYYSHNDPSPMLLILPTVEMAEAFSKDRLAPMIRDTRVLTEVYSNAKSRTSNNTILHKSFSGGQITMIGANSPSNLAMRPIRILLCDEINRYPISAGTEGNPVDLADARTTTFHNRLRFLVSTPTDKETCQITKHYNLSSKGKYCMYCPSCEAPNFITRDSLVINDDPLSVKASCKECGSIHSENEWKSKEGIYIHEEPENKIRGFWLNGYASSFITWEKIHEKYLVAKTDDQTLKVFMNTVEAEVWEEQGERADPEILLERRENYKNPPLSCLVLTCAVDVQDNRLEYEVCGWGDGFESWSIDYGVLRGDPGRIDVWKDLKELFLKKRWEHESGHEMRITAMTIDLGGHHTQQVYEFCEKMKPHRIWPIRGKDGWGRPLIVQGQSKIKRTGKKVDLWTIAVDQAKIWVERSLKQTEPGPGYCHFSHHINDELYFEGLTSEKLVTTIKKSFPVKTWVLEKGKRNEPLDLRVYNYACVKMLNPVWESLQEIFCLKIRNQKTKKLKNKRKTGILSPGIVDRD